MLDKIFEYSVPEAMSEQAQPGVRVRVRLAGRLVDGFLVSRTESTQFEGALAPISRVLGVPVLDESTLALARAVADRYAGTLASVLRDAIPPRHVRIEQTLPTPSANPNLTPRKSSLSRRQVGIANRRAVMVALADDPATQVSELVGRADGRALVLVPDERDVQRFHAALVERFGTDTVGLLTGSESAAQRYEVFLKARAGGFRVVIGTRHAAFAQLPDLSLMVMWDDGDDSYGEVRSPGWHAREVLFLRSHMFGTSLAVMSHSRTPEVQRLVESNWLSSDQPGRGFARDHAPKILTASDQHPHDPDVDGVRIPHFAWQTIHDGLTRGPVLVQVARSGFGSALVCQVCRASVRCEQCSGPLQQAEEAGPLVCRWCGHEEADWSCVECGATELRAIAVGSGRTASELKRAFKDISVVVSGRAGGVINEVGNQPLIVVATVGAEPRADAGFAAGVLLDAQSLLSRTDLRSEEETVRRWFNALALVRPASRGGVVAIPGDPTHRAIQAIVRLDPAGWASRELADRVATGLPPATRVLSLSGAPVHVAEFVSAMNVPTAWRILGPVPMTGRGGVHFERTLIVVPHKDGSELAAAALRTMKRSAKPDDRVRVRMDPLTLF